MTNFYIDVDGCVHIFKKVVNRRIHTIYCFLDAYLYSISMYSFVGREISFQVMGISLGSKKAQKTKQHNNKVTKQKNKQ